MDNISLVFNVLDSYARKRYQCFLAEMTPLDGRTRFNLCFRPLSVNHGASTRPDCTYLELSAADVSQISGSGALGPSAKEKLDRNLGDLT